MSGRYQPGQAVTFRLPPPDDAAGAVYQVCMVSIGRDHVSYGLARRGTKVVVRMARHEALEPAAAAPLPQGVRILAGDPEADVPGCEW